MNRTDRTPCLYRIYILTCVCVAGGGGKAVNNKQIKIHGMTVGVKCYGEKLSG